METLNPPKAQPLRLSATDLMKRLDAGELVTVLDVRNPKVWEASDRKIRNAVRLLPHQTRIEPSWPRGRLTVAYCT